MFRAILVASLVGLCLTLVSAPCFAGSYLSRAALLLDGSRVERDTVRPHADDKELVELVHDLAAARMAAARRMGVPSAVASVHPHLLLVLENTERACAAALDGNLEKFAQHLARARAEDATFRALVAGLGYTLPGSAPPR
jgi:hypothetical protein